MTIDKEKYRFIYPDDKICVKINSFMILPTRRLIFGTILVGGNCIQFKPHYFFQQKYSIEVLLDNICLVKVINHIKFSKTNKYRPSIYEMLNSFALNIQETDKTENCVSLPTPQFNIVQNIKLLDPEQLEQYLLKSYMAEHNILNIQTYDGSTFFFFTKSDFNLLIQQEILILGSKTYDILKSCDKMISYDDESYFILEPPVDEESIIDSIKKSDQNGIYPTKRKVSFVQSINFDDEDKARSQIFTPENQIKTLQQQKSIPQSPNQKKLSRMSSNQSQTKIKQGNRIDDKNIQKMWKQSFEGKVNFELYQKYDLLIDLQNSPYINKIKLQLTKQLIKEALIDQNQNSKLKLQKILRLIIRIFRHNQEQNSKSPLSDGSLSLSQQQSTEQLIQFIQQNQGILKQKIDFLGRKSMIFTDQFIQFIISRFIEPKFLLFKIFTQYSACRDGQHLNNFYQSYDQTIHDYYPDPPGTEPRIDSLNYNINRQNLEMTQNNMIIIQLETYYVIIFIPSQIPKHYQSFSDISTSFLIISKELYEQIQQCLDLISIKSIIEQDDQTFIKLEKLKEEILIYKVSREKIIKLTESQFENIDIDQFKICYKNRDSFCISTAIQLSYNLLQLTFSDCDIFNFRRSDLILNNNLSYEKIKDVEVIRFVINYIKTEQDYKRKLTISPEK